VPQNFITSEHDALFKENVRGLLDDLSQKSTFVVVLPATETRCNNCVWDQLHKTSSGKYNGTGPKPFDGKVCPVCLGKGTIKTAKQRKFPAIVAWSKSEKSGNQVPTVAGELPWGYARIKVDIKYLSLLEMAEAFVVDSIRCSKVNKIDLAEGTGLLSKVLVNFVVKRDA